MTEIGSRSTTNVQYVQDLHQRQGAVYLAHQGEMGSAITSDLQANPVPMAPFLNQGLFGFGL